MENYRPVGQRRGKSSLFSKTHQQAAIHSIIKWLQTKNRRKIKFNDRAASANFLKIMQESNAFRGITCASISAQNPLSP